MELEQLILHEAHDKDRLLRLRDRIEAEGEQRNPIIVSSQGLSSSSSSPRRGRRAGPTSSTTSASLISAA